MPIRVETHRQLEPLPGQRWRIVKTTRYINGIRVPEWIYRIVCRWFAWKERVR